MRKKRLERVFLDALAAQMPGSRVARVVESESPDFVVELDGEPFGIEVTRFTPPRQIGAPIPDEQNALRAKVLSDAYRRAVAAGLPPLHVQAIFKDDPPLTRASVREVGGALFRALASRAHGLAVWERTRWDLYEKSDGLAMFGVLAAHRVPEWSHVGSWHPSGPGWVRHATVDEIRSVIRRKEGLVERYRRRVDRVGLLLVFDGVARSTTFWQVPSHSVDAPVQCAFDAVWCLDWNERRVLEIPVLQTDGSSE